MTGRSVRVENAALAFANDGEAYSEAFSDLYHSIDGGLAQARAVFLEGNALPARWGGRDTFTILETGFGLGLNFLAAWDAWRADAKNSAQTVRKYCRLRQTPGSHLACQGAYVPARTN